MPYLYVLVAYTVTFIQILLPFIERHNVKITWTVSKQAELELLLLISAWQLKTWSKTKKAMFNPIQDGPFRGCSRKVEAKKNPSLKSKVICYNYETGHNYTLPKEDPKKYINHVTHPLSSADISISSTEVSKFCYIKNCRCRLPF